MSEKIVIPAIPEEQTTPERAFWDTFIGALHGLANMSPEIDMIESLQDMAEETEEDAAMLLYNYYIEITTEPGEENDLVEVESFLRHSGILE